ncbi:MAG TPA: hypothetical protein VFM32_06750 [Spongiibacteraceae bacterium]|nr:hypothetical protein [Spongiibacteraceae bacterium]
MSEAREILLKPGQRTSVEATGAQLGYLYCLKGSAHLTSSQMGVGWVMDAGDGCLLRTPMRYRVFARTAVRLVFEPSEQPKPKLN